jgi:hypothetical protein
MLVALPALKLTRLTELDPELATMAEAGPESVIARSQHR